MRSPRGFRLEEARRNVFELNSLAAWYGSHVFFAAAHHRLCDRRGRFRGFGGFQLFQCQLKLRDLVVQRFRGAPELIVPGEQ